MGKPRSLIFIQNDDECWMALSHKPNQDGYFRKVWGSRSNRHAEFMHRVVWRMHNGEIPEGHEIDHKCRNRFCCNPDHLQVLSRKEHSVKTNKQRYASRKEDAKSYWEATKCSGTQLGEIYGVTFSAACKWIREWKGSETIRKE